MKANQWLWKSVAVVGLCSLLAGCGGGGGSSSGSGPTSQPISVSVSPSAASVPIQGTKQFTAAVANDSSNKGVTWSLSGTGCSGAACGTLSSTSSNPVTYTAPATVPNPATLTVTATSVADTTKSALATVTVTSTSASCHVGPPYTSFTGTAVVSLQLPPPTPAPVGQLFVEPEFAPDVQNQIVRVTDANTSAQIGLGQNSFSNSAGAEQNRWSYDDTHFVIHQINSETWVVFNFDPNCSDTAYMNVAPDPGWNASSVGGPSVVSTWAKVALSPLAGPNGDIIAYGVANNQPFPTIQRGDHNHAAQNTAFSNLFVFDNIDKALPSIQLIANLSVTWDTDGSEALAVSGNLTGDTVTGQDNYDVILVCFKNYDGLGHDGCRYWITSGSQAPSIGGDFGPSCSPTTTPCGFTQTFTVHSNELNHRNDAQANDAYTLVEAPPPLKIGALWQASTTNVQFCSSVCGGHDVKGNSIDYHHFACSDPSCAPNNDDRSWPLRSFGGANFATWGTKITAGLETAPPLPASFGEDGHPALALGEGFLYESLIPQGTVDCKIVSSAWQCENLAIATDPANYGHETVFRFVHHYSETASNFWALAKPNVSPDGKFFMFASNWGNILLNPDSTTRVDVFIHEMK